MVGSFQYRWDVWSATDLSTASVGCRVNMTEVWRYVGRRIAADHGRRNNYFAGTIVFTEQFGPLFVEKKRKTLADANGT